MKVKEAISFTSEDLDKKRSNDNFTNGYTVNIDSIIYGSYVTMKRLSNIVYETFSNTPISGATHINIFIDLYSVLHQVFSKGYRTSIDNATSITPALINMCGHYRSFFKSLGVTTTFYLVYSTNTHPINKKLVFGYNSTFESKSKIKLFKNITNANFELLGTLSPYLPNIHFIKSESGYEVGVIIANLIETINDGNPNLIISKDLYPVQLCFKYPYTSYLFPIKKFHRDSERSYTTDESIMIPLAGKDTHPIAFWNLIALRRNLKPDQLYQILPENFMLFESLHGFPERDIALLAGNANKCIKIIKDMGGDQIKVPINQMYYNSEYSNIIPMNLVEARYNAIDIDFVLANYKQDIESKSINLQNLDDNGTVNMINSKYFEYNPINILNL